MNGCHQQDVSTLPRAPYTMQFTESMAGFNAAMGAKAVPVPQPSVQLTSKYGSLLLNRWKAAGVHYKKEAALELERLKVRSRIDITLEENASSNLCAGDLRLRAIHELLNTIGIVRSADQVGLLLLFLSLCTATQNTAMCVLLLTIRFVSMSPSSMHAYQRSTATSGQSTLSV